ncbi:MAG: radical SAM protein [Pseudomonadota bacterium]
MTLSVCEIFYSIQGESSFAGTPCAFVRLAGCNLSCLWCDTPYARDEPGVSMSVEEVIGRVRELRAPIVEVTGGEPLLQEQTPALLSGLLSKGFQVLVETNGSLDIRIAPSRCVRIVDIKCPSSGMADKNDLENLNRLGPRDEVKFVMADREDYDFARRLVALLDMDNARVNPVHFSPVSGRLEPRELAEWILADHLDVSLGLQLHKILWGDRRGV